MKYTANTRQAKPARWFHFRGSPLTKSTAKSVNTTSEITSWMTLSCQSVNGPPSSALPMRLAGTWKQYSNSAMPQLSSTMATTPKRWSCDLKAMCPYHAKVIKMLEQISSAMVEIPFINIGLYNKNYRCLVVFELQR